MRVISKSNTITVDALCVDNFFILGVSNNNHYNLLVSSDKGYQICNIRRGTIGPILKGTPKDIVNAMLKDYDEVHAFSTYTALLSFMSEGICRV